MNYEGNIIRPPSEADAIILQITVGCSHNSCCFCGAYRDVRFRIKSNSEIDRDIAFAKTHCMRQKKVFLADGDALIVPQKHLERILLKIRENLPWVNRIALYSGAKAIRSKTDKDLRCLKNLGLARIYLGVESGHDEVLEAIDKKETSQSLLAAGQRVIQAGIFLSTTVILGIAGRQLSREHAKRTATLLNKMKPNQICALSLIILENTPLSTEVSAGSFPLLSAKEMTRELRELIVNLKLDRVLFMANHSSNYLPLSGRLLRDKNRFLQHIDHALRGYSPFVPEHFRAL